MKRLQRRRLGATLAACTKVTNLRQSYNYKFWLIVESGSGELRNIF